MNTLCEYLGGSHLYKLQTPNSDEDLRGVYVTPDLTSFFGFAKDESKVIQTDLVDSSYTEVKRFFHLLAKTNTSVLEALLAPNECLTKTTGVFDAIQSEWKEFVNSRNLLNSLRGYIKGEKRYALGERTGKLGGVRKAQLEKHGYSPKNASHLVRLSHCAESFFTTGHYPVDMSQTPVYDLCMGLKTSPEDFTYNQVEKICDDCESVVMQLEDRHNLEFNFDLACRYLSEIYKTHLF
jgi:hypothetical protein